jgi:hypothetical protein
VAKTIEELPVFQKALAFCSAVSAIIDRPGFGKDRKLREQISDANDFIPANMREGFEQSTDVCEILVPLEGVPARGACAPQSGAVKEVHNEEGTRTDGGDG